MNKRKKCSLEQTGERNVVLDLAISAHKYLKIVTHEEKNHVQTLTALFKTPAFFLRRLVVIFHMFECRNHTFDKNKQKMLKKNWRRKRGIRFGDFSSEIPLNCHT